jgi:FeS assembly protein IscX
MKWTWQDTAEIAHELAQKYPERDPLKVSTDELIRLVVSLPSFADDPVAVAQHILESIQAEWYDELNA